MTLHELAEYATRHGAKMIDARFVDFLGEQKHLTYPIERLAELVEDGLGVDGSSVASHRRLVPGYKDIYSLSPEELAEVPTVPGSLDASLDALHADRSFLMKGDVLSNDLIDAWISYKREAEPDHVGPRPVPAEFQLYYDC